MPKKISKSIKEDIKYATLNFLHNNENNNISIRAIAKNVGIATGTIYNYYGSKEEIYLEIIKDIWYEELYKELPVDRNISIEDILNIMISLINGFYNNIQSKFFKVQDEKYYLHYIMINEMKNVLTMDLHVELESILKTKNINMDQFTSRFIVESLIQNSFYNIEQSKKIVNILISIINNY